MQKVEKEAARRSRVKRIVGTLSESPVFVEGQHDKRACMELGIEAITFNAAMYNNLDIDTSKTLYLIMDRDKGGKKNEAKLTSVLLEKYPESKIDTVLGKNLLSLLRSAHVEEIVAPYRELTDSSAVKRKKAIRWQKHI